jgi:hypothetical protein
VAYTLYDPTVWVDEDDVSFNEATSPKLEATRLDKLERLAHVVSAAISSHVVWQQGGRTYAARSDGHVLYNQGTSGATNAAAIQAAIDDANAGQQWGSNAYKLTGLVYIAPGSYDIDTTIVTRWGVSIVGQPGTWMDKWVDAGMWGTRLRGTSLLAGNPMFRIGDLASGARVIYNPHGIQIKDLLLDCSSSSGSAILVQDCFNNKFERLFIEMGSSQTGFDITGKLGVFDGTFDTEILDCAVKNGGRALHVHLTSGGSFTGTDGFVRNCRFMSQTIATMELDYGGWQISNNHLTHGGAAPHLLSSVSSIDVMNFNDNYCDSGTIEHVNIKCSHTVSMQGNIFLLDSVAHTPTGGSDAVVQLPWGKCLFMGNTMDMRNGGSGVKGFVYSGDTARGIIRNNQVFKGTGWADWVAPIVTSTGTAQAAVDTSAAYIGQNVVMT